MGELGPLHGPGHTWGPQEITSTLCLFCKIFWEAFNLGQVLSSKRQGFLQARNTAFPKKQLPGQSPGLSLAPWETVGPSCLSKPRTLPAALGFNLLPSCKDVKSHRAVQLRCSRSVLVHTGDRGGLHAAQRRPTRCSCALRPGESAQAPGMGTGLLLCVPCVG